MGNGHQPFVCDCGSTSDLTMALPCLFADAAVKPNKPDAVDGSSRRNADLGRSSSRATHAVQSPCQFGMEPKDYRRPTRRPAFHHASRVIVVQAKHQEEVP